MNPFIPDTLPLKKLDWSWFLPLIGRSNGAVARYDGLLQSLPNAALLLSPLTTQEAVLSSRIEGTQATLEDVLKYEAQPEATTQRIEDIQEVINYRKALRSAVSELSRRPLSLNLLKRTHSILLSNVRGKNRATADFRKVQNWIGAPGSTMENARYVPPAPDKLMDALDNFEKYIHYDEKDPLVQLAIIHAQFEIIHPFLDGNGRIGRIIIPLFLYEKEMLSSPMFYISAYFEKYRDEYYDRLNGITHSGKWDEWILFFLKAVEQQAQENSAKARKILELYNEMKEKIAEVARSQFAIQALDCLFDLPVFRSSIFQEKSRIPKPSAHRILSQLKDAKIISLLEEAKGRKAAVFVFDRLLEIVEQ
jgi:Fic family protein